MLFTAMKHNISRGRKVNKRSVSRCPRQRRNRFKYVQQLAVYRCGTRNTQHMYNTRHYQYNRNPYDVRLGLEVPCISTSLTRVGTGLYKSLVSRKLRYMHGLGRTIVPFVFGS